VLGLITGIGCGKKVDKYEEKMYERNVKCDGEFCLDRKNMTHTFPGRLGICNQGSCTGIRNANKSRNSCKTKNNRISGKAEVYCFHNSFFIVACNNEIITCIPLEIPSHHTWPRDTR